MKYLYHSCLHWASIRVYVSGQFPHILQPSSARITTSIMGKTGKKKKTTSRKRMKRMSPNIIMILKMSLSICLWKMGSIDLRQTAFLSISRNNIRCLHPLEWTRSGSWKSLPSSRKIPCCMTFVTSSDLHRLVHL